MSTDWTAEIRKVTDQLQALKAQAHDETQRLAALETLRSQQQERLRQLQVNIAAAQTTLEYLRQLQAEAAERAKAAAPSEPEPSDETSGD